MATEVLQPRVYPKFDNSAGVSTAEFFASAFDALAGAKEELDRTYTTISENNDTIIKAKEEFKQEIEKLQSRRDVKGIVTYADNFKLRFNKLFDAWEAHKIVNDETANLIQKIKEYKEFAANLLRINESRQIDPHPDDDAEALNNKIDQEKRYITDLEDAGAKALASQFCIAKKYKEESANITDLSVHISSPTAWSATNYLRKKSAIVTKFDLAASEAEGGGGAAAATEGAQQVAQNVITAVAAAGAVTGDVTADTTGDASEPSSPTFVDAVDHSDTSVGGGTTEKKN